MSIIPDNPTPRIGSMVLIAVAIVCAVAVTGVSAVAAAIKVERRSGSPESPLDLRRSTSAVKSPPASPAPAVPTARTAPKTDRDPLPSRLPDPVNDPSAPIPSAPASPPPSVPAAAVPPQPTPAAVPPTDTAPSIPLEREPVPTAAMYKSGLATMFWVGEPATADNGYIANSMSAWDENWKKNYGGFDDPTDRCAYWPCAFKPKENPFYVALPYNDLDDEGERKANAIRIPWYDPDFPQYRSQLKDRWIEARNGNTVCYGQWEDVGPFEEDDIEYVFGANTSPRNKVDLQAGIDLSPALWDCLKLDSPRSIQWRFIEASAVPKGVWKDIITGN